MEREIETDDGKNQATVRTLPFNHCWRGVLNSTDVLSITQKRTHIEKTGKLRKNVVAVTFRTLVQCWSLKRWYFNDIINLVVLDRRRLIK